MSGSTKQRCDRAWVKPGQAQVGGCTGVIEELHRVVAERGDRGRHRAGHSSVGSRPALRGAARRGAGQGRAAALTL
jgi:hypothetical protein